MFWINYFLICLLFYLIGSVPVAFIIIRNKYNKDIREEGSGNIGAMNSYDITGSKFTGIIVFIIDFLKGLIPALILTKLLYLPLNLCIVPLVCIIAGHNFSVWMKFKGGRGLAAAAGVGIVINFFLVIIWCLIFLIVYAVKKNVHIGNIIASILLPMAAMFLFPFISDFSYSAGIENHRVNSELLFALSSSITLLILIKHINPMMDIIKSFRDKY